MTNSTKNPFLKLKNANISQELPSILGDGGYVKNSQILTATMSKSSDAKGLAERLVDPTKAKALTKSLNNGPVFYIKGFNVEPSVLLGMFPDSFQLKTDGKKDGMIEVVTTKISNVAYLGSTNYRKITVRKNAAGNTVFKQPSDEELKYMFPSMPKEAASKAWNEAYPVVSIVSATTKAKDEFEASPVGHSLLGDNKNSSEGATTAYFLPVLQNLEKEKPFLVRADFMRTAAMPMSEVRSNTLMASIEAAMKEVSGGVPFSVCFALLDIVPVILTTKGESSNQYAIPVPCFSGQDVADVRFLVNTSLTSEGTYPNVKQIPYGKGLLEIGDGVKLVDTLSGFADGEDHFNYLVNLSSDVRFWDTKVRPVTNSALRDMIIAEHRFATNLQEVLNQLSNKVNLQLPAPSTSHVEDTPPFETLGLGSKISECMNGGVFKDEITDILKKEGLETEFINNIQAALAKANPRVLNMKLKDYLAMVN